MNIYLAGPMRGIKDFNFPLFMEATEKLREVGHTVFSPAENDIRNYGPEFFRSETGKQEDLKVKFSLRNALREDTEWICLKADTIVLLPGWHNSKGALAEYFLARALGHQIFYFKEKGPNGWHLRQVTDLTIKPERGE